jgi:hypothetical protein
MTNQIFDDIITYRVLMQTMCNKRRRLNSSATIQHYIYMTRSKKSATDSNAEGTSKVHKERACWTADDEEFMATFLLEHKAEAGDGANFKNTTFAAVGKELDLRKESDGRERKGGPKDDVACKTKWARVRNTIFLS